MSSVSTSNPNTPEQSCSQAVFDRYIALRDHQVPRTCLTVGAVEISLIEQATKVADTVSARMSGLSDEFLLNVLADEVETQAALLALNTRHHATVPARSGGGYQGLICLNIETSEDGVEVVVFEPAGIEVTREQAMHLANALQGAAQRLNSEEAGA